MNQKNSHWFLIATLTVIMTIYAFAQDDETETSEPSAKASNAIITCNGINYNSNEEIIRSLVSDIRDFTDRLPQLEATINGLNIDDLKTSLIHPLEELSLTLNTIQTNIAIIDSDSIAENLGQFQSLQAILEDFVGAVTAIEDQQITLPEIVLNMKASFQASACKLTYLIRVANEGM